MRRLRRWSSHGLLLTKTRGRGASASWNAGLSPLVTSGQLHISAAVTTGQTADARLR